MYVDPHFNQLSLPRLVEVSKTQHNSSSLFLARDLALPAAERQQMDVFVYISLHGFFLMSPLWGRTCVKGQRGGNGVGGTSFQEGLVSREFARGQWFPLSFLEQWMLGLLAERMLAWSSHPLQLRAGCRDIPEIPKSSFP